MSEHKEHIAIKVWWEDCVEGECDHRDEDGEPTDLSVCPSHTAEACIDCMEDHAQTRDPANWEAIYTWPCADTQPTDSAEDTP